MEKKGEIARTVCSNFTIIAFSRETIEIVLSRNEEIFAAEYTVTDMFFSFPHNSVSESFDLLTRSLLHHVWIYAGPPQAMEPVPKKVRYECKIKIVARDRDRWHLYHLSGRRFGTSFAHLLRDTLKSSTIFLPTNLSESK